MTQLRAHVYSLLTTTAIADVAPGGVTERGTLDDRPAQRPFLVYVFGSQTQEPGWRSGPKRLTLWVYVHDARGDYLKIDSVHDVIESVLTNAPPSSDGSGFMECTLVDRSIDLEDDVLNTFYKSARYQVVSSK